jgi:hypothetical protein
LLLLLLLLLQSGLSMLLEQQKSMAKTAAKIKQLAPWQRLLEELEEAALGRMSTTDFLDQQQVCADSSSMQHAAFELSCSQKMQDTAARKCLFWPYLLWSPFSALQESICSQVLTFVLAWPLLLCVPAGHASGKQGQQERTRARPLLRPLLPSPQQQHSPSTHTKRSTTCW